MWKDGLYVLKWLCRGGRLILDEVLIVNEVIDSRDIGKIEVIRENCDLANLKLIELDLPGVFCCSHCMGKVVCGRMVSMSSSGYVEEES